jgi:plasmid stabilization system protein ParE
MKRYEVLLSDKANYDMEAIYEYIAEKFFSPVIATKQYDRIVKAILSLEENPARIKIMDSEPERSQGFRPLIVDNYTVFFVITFNMVNVVRVLYSASDISKRLSEE